MFEIDIERTIKSSASEVWNLLSRFGDIDWVPGMGELDIVLEGDGPGMRRTIPGASGPCVEQLDELDHTRRMMRYSFVSGLPLPVDNLTVEVRVKHVGSDLCHVVWTCRASPRGISRDEAMKIIEQFYEQLASTVESAVTKNPD